MSVEIPKPRAMWVCEECYDGNADTCCYPAEEMVLDMNEDGDHRWMCGTCSGDYGTGNAECDGSGVVMTLAEWLTRSPEGPDGEAT